MAYSTLEPCNGPACPRCGCRDTKVLREAAATAEAQPFFPRRPKPGEVAPAAPLAPAGWHQGAWFGAGQAICKHCRTQFSFRELPAPAVPPEPTLEDPPAVAAEDPQTICPDCGGPKFYVYSVKDDKQYRKCRDCGSTGRPRKGRKKS